MLTTVGEPPPSYSNHSHPPLVLIPTPPTLIPTPTVTTTAVTVMSPSSSHSHFTNSTNISWSSRPRMQYHNSSAVVSLYDIPLIPFNSRLLPVLTILFSERPVGSSD